MSYRYIINNTDTDSIMFSKPDGSPFSEEERAAILDEINFIMPEFIEWEDDGYYPSVVVFKAKNYVLFDGEKKTIKGSSLKDSKKELALREMLDRMIDVLISNKSDVIDDCVAIYHEYVREALNIQDINRWTTKKTITSTLMTSTRTNETKIMDAIGNEHVQEGDKIWVYSAIDGMIPSLNKDGSVMYNKKTGLPKMIENKVLKLAKDWDKNNPNEDKWHYVERVWKTVDILSTVLPIEKFTKYHLKKNRGLLV